MNITFFGRIEEPDKPDGDRENVCWRDISVFPST